MEMGVIYLNVTKQKELFAVQKIVKNRRIGEK